MTLSVKSASTAEMASTANPSDSRTRRREQRNAMRHRIIDATMDLLLVPRTPPIRMELIAEAADVSTASLYKYFPEGKEELFEALIDRVLDTDEEYLQDAFESDEPPLEKLVAVGAAYVRFGSDYPGFFQLVAQPTAFGPLTDGQADRIAQRVAGIVERVASLIAQGQRDDVPDGQRFASHLDAEATARVLHGAWNGLLGLSLRGDALKVRTEDLAELSTLATQIVQHGMMSHRLDEPRAVAFAKLVAGATRADVDAHLHATYDLGIEDLVDAE